MTGSKPYGDLPDHEISAAFSKGRYPNLESVPAFRNTIIKYWRQSYTTVEEALQDVKLEGNCAHSAPPSATQRNENFSATIDF
jgi:hypothetical protein